MTMQDEMRALVCRHHANFSDQIAAVDRLLADRDDKGLVSAEQITEAEGITHQMKGTAGSMGFPTVGAAAAALDDSLKKVRRLSGPATTGQLQDTRDLLRDLKRVAGETTPEMSTLYNADFSQLAR